MFISLSNTPRDYAWGSSTAIAEFRGVAPSGAPEAELWLGTHPGSPTRAGEAVGGVGQADAAHATLAEWIAAAPKALLGAEIASQRDDLPILLKILAAASPLSLQVHPTPEQAIAGFAAENARGIAVSDPARNYKDPYPKPEIIVAVSERFEALCGFRPAGEVAEIVAALRAAGGRALEPLTTLLDDPTRIADALDWLLSGDDAVAACVDAVMAVAAAAESTGFPIADTLTTAREIGAHYPGDPGIIVAMLMNRVSLRRGECLFAPAGLLHAYLSGLGIELMTASDNVVRGGLTPKHIDTDELRSLLSFEQRAAELLPPSSEGGVALYAPAAPFALALTTADEATVPLTGPAIVLADGDTIRLTDEAGLSIDVARGDAAFVSADVQTLAVTGPGRAWVAMARA